MRLLGRSGSVGEGLCRFLVGHAEEAGEGVQYCGVSTRVAVSTCMYVYMVGGAFGRTSLHAYIIHTHPSVPNPHAAKQATKVIMFHHVIAQRNSTTPYISYY